MTRLALIVAAAFTLVGCEPIPSKTTASPAPLVSSITDYGDVDGCSVKWVETREHPNFWLVRCGQPTSTFYNTGGTAPTKVGVGVYK